MSQRKFYHNECLHIDSSTRQKGIRVTCMGEVSMDRLTDTLSVVYSIHVCIAKSRRLINRFYRGLSSPHLLWHRAQLHARLWYSALSKQLSTSSSHKPKRGICSQTEKTGEEKSLLSAVTHWLYSRCTFFSRGAQWPCYSPRIRAILDKLTWTIETLTVQGLGNEYWPSALWSKTGPYSVQDKMVKRGLGWVWDRDHGWSRGCFSASSTSFPLGRLRDPD
jgi:hypothetical protein